jgi:hypothetical protein
MEPALNPYNLLDDLRNILLRRLPIVSHIEHCRPYDVFFSSGAGDGGDLVVWWEGGGEDDGVGGEDRGAGTEGGGPGGGGDEGGGEIGGVEGVLREFLIPAAEVSGDEEGGVGGSGRGGASAGEQGREGEGKGETGQMWREEGEGRYEQELHLLVLEAVDLAYGARGEYEYATQREQAMMRKGQKEKGRQGDEDEPMSVRGVTPVVV